MKAEDSKRSRIYKNSIRYLEHCSKFDFFQIRLPYVLGSQMGQKLNSHHLSKKRVFPAALASRVQNQESSQICLPSLPCHFWVFGRWQLVCFPAKKSVIVAPRNNTYYQSKCLLSWVLGGNFLASEVHDLVKKLRGREDRRERGAVIFQALTLCCYTRYILSQNRVGSEKKLYSDY